MIKTANNPSPQEEKDRFQLGDLHLESRLILGTARYPDHHMMLEALKASETSMVTVSLRRVDWEDTSGETLLSLLRKGSFQLLPNTAGCYTVKDAVLTAELGREALKTDWIKLEVIGDEDTLYPNMEAVLEASELLVSKGFKVLPYCTDDPVLCRRLQDLGCMGVMPLAAPIGSGAGVLNPYNLRLVRKAVKLPVIVDAGLGVASDAALAMELGADGVLINTAVAEAREPVLMARSMFHAVKAGRMAFLAGRITKRLHAQASSSFHGRINS